MSTTPSIAVSLLIMFLLLSQAQGIRLEKGFISVTQQNKNIYEDSTVLTKRSDAANSGVLGKDCGHDDHHCSSSGGSRKLITLTSSTSTTTTSKNEKNNIVGMHVGNPRAKSSSASGSDKPHEEKEEAAAAAQQQYPDLIDMTEMDYSPARRKPPIHN